MSTTHMLSEEDGVGCVQNHSLLLLNCETVFFSFVKTYFSSTTFLYFYFLTLSSFEEQNTSQLVMFELVSALMIL